MPRRARLDGPGVPVHVTDRGDLGRALFVTDDDKAFVVSRYLSGAPHVDAEHVIELQEQRLVSSGRRPSGGA